jgi:hypothetical protein
MHIRVIFVLKFTPHYETTSDLDFQKNRNIYSHCWEKNLASSVIVYIYYMSWNKNGIRPPHNLQIPEFIRVIFKLAKACVIMRLFYVRCPITGSHTLLADLTQLGCNTVFSASFFITHILVPSPYISALGTQTSVIFMLAVTSNFLSQVNVLRFPAREIPKGT